MELGAEERRLRESRTGARWRRWGPYLSERQWGTVREDYSDNGDAWSYFSHDQSRSRAYRWGEDGLAGISDTHQRLCFAIALWNEHDPILKERLFGLTNTEGNHGEDVKEYYFYLDNLPTHSYQRWLYKYPHQAYPYEDLVTTNRSRSRLEPEYELIDTGIFDDNRYFDVEVEYAKDGPNDILCRITVHNRGDVDAPLHVLAHPLVPQHLVGGDRRCDRDAPTAALDRGGRPSGGAGGPRRTRPLPPARRTRRRPCCSARTRPTTPASAATPTPRRS